MPLSRELRRWRRAELVSALIEGGRKRLGRSPAPSTRAGTAPLLPNLFFTRDVAVALNDHIMIGSMRYGIRWTEALVMKAIFRYNPRLRNEGIIYDGSREHRLNYTLEGGDVHPLRSDTLMIGFSERSSPAAIDQLGIGAVHQYRRDRSSSSSCRARTSRFIST